MRRREQKPDPDRSPFSGDPEISPSTIVQLRDGGGRLGRVLCPSPNPAYDWEVAWHNTNLVTDELSRDLVIHNPASAEAVTRRPPARSTSATSPALPAYAPKENKLAIVSGGRRRAGREY